MGCTPASKGCNTDTDTLNGARAMRTVYDVVAPSGRLIATTSDPEMVAFYATIGYSTRVCS